MSCADPRPGITAAFPSGFGDWEFLACSPDLISAARANYPRCQAQPRGQCRIVVTRNLQDDRVRRLSRETGAVLLVGLLDGRATIGPLQLRDGSVCLACFHHWALTAGPRGAANGAVSSSFLAVVMARVRRAIDDYIRNRRTGRLETSVVEIREGSDAVSVHPVFPLRSCECAARAARSDLRIHVSSLIGMVRLVEGMAPPVAGIHHARAVFVTPARVPGIGVVPGVQHAFGSGTTMHEAQTRCLGEAVEGYSLVYRGNERLLRARLCDLGCAAIDPLDILLFSDRQYARRKALDGCSPHRYSVPQRFEPKREIEWTRGVDLADGTRRWVPAACCYTWFRSTTSGPAFAYATASGCGSGPSQIEATEAALLEAVERDAVAIWWYNRIPRPGLNLQALGDARILKVRDALHRLGRTLKLLDVTTDLGIPVYVAVTARQDGREPVIGSAAHASPVLAAWKAVRESVQNWSITRMNPENPEIRHWLASASTLDHSYLEPACTVSPPASTDTVCNPAAHLSYAVNALRHAGLHPIAVNLSRSDVLSRTVRVVVPGLRTLANCYAPGRLYDVPVRLKWSAAPLTEDDLNPTDCPF